MVRRSRSVRPRNAAGFSRRIVLRRLGGLAAFAGIRSALADDRALDALMGDSDHGGFDQGFDQASRTVHMPKATIPMLSPGTAEATRRAVEVYDGIVARGGWPEVSKVLELRLGTNHSSVGELRARLTISGDLDPHASAVENDTYDSYLEEAVRRFQARHGLTIDGVVHEATFDAMNVPAATRRDQLKVNIERLKTLTGNLGPRYVVCNIPAARIEAIEHDVAVSRHTGVVGKPDRPSPEIDSKIIEINFNPYWTVPASIVRKDLIPRMQDQPDYLTKNHIRILDAAHRELAPSQINWYSEDATNYTFKQDPGSQNSPFVDRRRVPTGNPSGISQPTLDHVLHASSGVVKRRGLNTWILAKKLAALIKCHGMRKCFANICFLHSTRRDQVVHDPQMEFPLYENRLCQKQVGMFGHSSG